MASLTRHGVPFSGRDRDPGSTRPGRLMERRGKPVKAPNAQYHRKATHAGRQDSVGSGRGGAPLSGFTYTTALQVNLRK